jgi:aspartyl-tRNA(Asn)/glutamyl-tRNA(Gln) amidotransferase subunit A
MVSAATPADEIAFQSVLSTSALVKSKKVSPVELTHACLRRIEAQNPSLNAFITVTADSALADAKAAEAEVQRGGWRGPLHGIPIALKDMIDTAGIRTTGASALFKDRIPHTDAAVVERLRRAGAILLGKLNMQEFAYGGTSVPSHYGPVRNPWDLQCIAGGSSGGSAAAVAAVLCYAALGSDTGGSIREPAAFCGVVGMKATYGRVSNRGVIPLASSLDHIGPLTRTVEDCAVVLEAISGYDPHDVTSEDRPVERYHDPVAQDLGRVRIGIPREFFYADLHPEVESAINHALDVLTALGAEPREVSLSVSTDRTVFRAEAFAYHAEHIAQSPHLYQPETLAKMRLGASIDTRTYINARRHLMELRHGMAALFSAVDVLVTPTAPVPSPRLSDYPATFEGVLAMEGSSILRNTRPFNMFGIPTITVPCGMTQGGLPVGLQISGPPWQERRTLAVARAYESASSWHARPPPLAGRSAVR